VTAEPLSSRVESAIALEVENVTHAYGARLALDQVSFKSPAGQFAVLLGLNGAGKSTLFSIITHLYACRSGAVRVFGHDVARDSGRALASLGVVFQSRTLDIDLSVEQNLLYHGALQGLSRSETRRRQGDLLARVGLADRLSDKARHLSGGQQRRLEIARALLHRPRLLILDEPTAGLDLNARADILGLVRALVADAGASVLWTTHLIDEAQADDLVIVLHRGRVLAEDRAEAIVARAGATSLSAAFRALTGADGEAEA